MVALMFEKFPCRNGQIGPINRWITVALGDLTTWGPIAYTVGFMRLVSQYFGKCGFGIVVDHRIHITIVEQEFEIIFLSRAVRKANPCVEQWFEHPMVACVVSSGALYGIRKG